MLGARYLPPRSPALVTALVSSIVAVSGCSQDDSAPASESTPAAASEEVGGPSAGAAEAVADAVPSLRGRLRSSVLSWGRVRFSWSPAEDDHSSANQIRYRLTGRFAGPQADDPAPAALEPLVVDTEPGALEIEVAVTTPHLSWTVSAIDAAGGVSAESERLLIRNAPPVASFDADVPPTRLVRCASEGVESLICVAESGRLAIWDGRRWRTQDLSHGSEPALAQTDQALYLVSVRERLLLDLEDEPVVVEDTFEGEPTQPFVRFAIEPTGLALWVDGGGRLWASDGGPFRALSDPFFLGPDASCPRIRDVMIWDDRGFAWCDGGPQLLLRTDDETYGWTAIPAEQRLPDRVRPRRLLFGEGRQITLVDWSGQAWRYDIGGWRLIYDALDQAPATAVSATGDARLIWLALAAADDEPDAPGATVLAVDTLGGSTEVVRLPTRHDVIDLAWDDEGGRAVTAAGEVFQIDPPRLRYQPWPGLFGRSVRAGANLVGLLLEGPEHRLWRPNDSLPSVFPALDEAWLVHDWYWLDESGELLAAVDRGPEGGAVIRLSADDARIEPFVYPPPADPDAEPPPLPPDAEPPLPPPPWERLVGVGAETLEVEPPLPPPIRAIAMDAATGTGVAVGEGGAVWLAVEGGWLGVDLGLTVPIPLLSVRIVGDHHYLVGGLHGVVLSCEWDLCTATEVPIGDIRGFQPWGDTTLAYGSGTQVATLEAQGAWTVEDFELRPPVPGDGNGPTTWLRVERRPDGLRWLLGDDGSVWLEQGRGFWAMAHVVDPIDLWLDDGAGAIVATRTGVYRVIPPN